MQFTPAGASAAHQKLGAGPPGPPVEAASASGAPERARVAQSAKLMASGHRVRVCALQRRDGNRAVQLESGLNQRQRYITGTSAHQCWPRLRRNALIGRLDDVFCSTSPQQPQI